MRRSRKYSAWSLSGGHGSANTALKSFNPVFGHICPVFFTAEPFTETKQERQVGRHIPRDVMLKVVRRDGQVCAECRINVPDSEVQFDDLIPVARGGPTTAENLRVLCRPCNRRKRDDAPPIV